MRVIFNGRHQSGRLDLEATEMTVRSVMHQAGASVLARLLCFASPTADQRIIPCACGRQAHYRELRSKPVLTAVGKVEVSRPYYLCPQCHTGQFPADVELDIENTEFSPGVRRMQAVVGQEAPFDHGRQQMKLLADLEVTTKSVERTAEAIGGDIAQGERKEIQRAVQLDLPVIVHVRRSADALNTAIVCSDLVADSRSVPSTASPSIRRGRNSGAMVSR